MSLYDYKLYFSDKIGGKKRGACALLMKNANTLLTITNLVSVMTNDYRLIVNTWSLCDTYFVKALVHSSYTLHAIDRWKLFISNFITRDPVTPVGPATITDALLLLVFCDICSSSLSLSFESLDSILISNFHYYFQDGR